MTRVLPLIALLVLAACGGTAEAPPAGGAAQGPTVSVGGSFRALYGNARQ